MLTPFSDRSLHICSNAVACAAQWVILLWIFGLVLFLIGAFKSIPSVLVGAVPVAATLVFIGWSIRLVAGELHTKLMIQNKNVGAAVAVSDDGVNIGASDVAVKIWAHKLTAEDLKRYFPRGQFVSTSGVQKNVHVDQYVAMPCPQGGQVSILDAVEFEAEYNEYEPLDAVSQAQLLRTWSAILRRDGAVYSKHVKVNAKRATEEGVIETVVGGNVEARRPYSKNDYIVCGSRGGRYAMEAQLFNSRYISDRPGPATERKLANVGFKSYMAQGKVRCLRTLKE